MTLLTNLMPHGSLKREGHHRFEWQNIDIEVYAAPAGSVTLPGIARCRQQGRQGHDNMAMFVSLREEQFRARRSRQRRRRRSCCVVT